MLLLLYRATRRFCKLLSKQPRRKQASRQAGKQASRQASNAFIHQDEIGKIKVANQEAEQEMVRTKDKFGTDS